MKHLMIWLVRLYKKFISPILPNTCRFTPSCSSYAIEAFEKRGFFAGFILTVWRILRCNPFCKGGYDPVPEKGFRRVKTTQHTDSETVAKEDSIEAQNATLQKALKEETDSTEGFNGQNQAEASDDPSPKNEIEAQGEDIFEA
jgi:putative membrane protein insertion efficiency factor